MCSICHNITVRDNKYTFYLQSVRRTLGTKEFHRNKYDLVYHDQRIFQILTSKKRDLRGDLRAFQ